MTDLTEEQRKTECLRRAWMLAMSGTVGGWREVEAGLIERGWPDAARWLDDPDLRRKMDEICIRARAGRG